MPRDGSGSYYLPSGNPVVFGTTIEPLWANVTMSDVAVALANSVARDGQSIMTGPLNMGGFAITNALLNASNLASGTVPDARFPAVLPAASGVNLTNLNASQLTSGTIPDARFPGTLPALNGSNLTALNASNLASGTIPVARINGGTSAQFVRGDGVYSNTLLGPLTVTPTNGQFSINATGNVVIAEPLSGIGLTATAPTGGVAARLNAAGGSSWQALEIVNSGTNAGASIRYINAHTGGSAWDLGVRGGDTTGAFRLRYNGAAVLDVMQVGNVTINAPSAGYALTVNNFDAGVVSAARFTGGSQATGEPDTTIGNQAGIFLDSTASGFANGGTLFIGSNGHKFAAIKGFYQDGSSNGRGDMVFSTRRVSTDTTLAEVMRIGYLGNVTINAPSNFTTLTATGIALGAVLGNESNVAEFGSHDTNSTRLVIKSRRVSAGSTHDTSRTKLQRRVDATDMGFIEFGSGIVTAGIGYDTAAYATWTSSGSLTTSTPGAGDPDISMNGGQLKFPGTQRPSSNANTLDDYEEGFWTPGTGTPNMTVANTVSTYCKIGSLVHAKSYFTVTNNTGANASTFTVNGFPFTSFGSTWHGGFEHFQGAGPYVLYNIYMDPNATASFVSINGVMVPGAVLPVMITWVYRTND